jgi:proton glutamate symport protein
MLAVIRRVSLTGWIMLAIVAGVLAGWLWPRQAQELQFVSNIFLRLIKCVVAPLIFATLVVGVAGHADDWKTVGRLALKSLIYFEAVTTAALCVGLASDPRPKRGRDGARPGHFVGRVGTRGAAKLF